MISTEVLANDVLLNITGGSLGRCAVVPSDFLKGNVSQHVCILRPIEILPQYIHCFILSAHFSRFMRVTGSGREGLPKYNLEKMLIPIPPIKEQIRIINKVKEWMTLVITIEKETSSLQENLERTKSLILEQAIKGKLVPQDPADEPAEILLQQINPNAVVSTDTSHYGQLPNGWCYTTMNYICQLYDGEKIEDMELINLDAKYLRGKSEGNALNKGRFVPEKTTMILVDGENSGEIFTAPINGYQGSTFKLLDINEEMNAEYVKMIIRIYQKRLRDNKVGSAIPHLNKKMFREILVPVPPIAEQTRIVGRTNELMSKITELTEAL